MKFRTIDLRKIFKEVSDTRYPHTYHRDFVRNERALHAKRHLTRANVAMVDNLIKEQIGELPALAQLEYGAILYLAKQDPHAFIRAMKKKWFSEKVLRLAEQASEHPNHYDGSIYETHWYPKDW